MSVRLRRLQADYEQMRAAFSNHPYVRIRDTHGYPPERYEIEYRVMGLAMDAEGTIRVKREHVAQIVLTLGYPRQAPQCRMLTPIFHPNIAPHAICIGDHWAAGESLADLVARIGQMIAYQSYNTKSPLNGEAARWADEHPHRLPVDRVDLATDVSQLAARAPAPAPSPAAPSASPSRPSSAFAPPGTQPTGEPAAVPTPDRAAPPLPAAPRAASFAPPPAAGDAAVPLPMAWIEVSCAGHVWGVPLERERIVLGRPGGLPGPDIDLSADPATSRAHAEIKLEDGLPMVTDLGSTNGTWLNGRPLTPYTVQPLRDGDVIEVGRATRLVVHY